MQPDNFNCVIADISIFQNNKMSKKRIVIALGGNAILNKGDDGTFQTQYKNVLDTMVNITELIKDESLEVVITHGNGPQVGSILIQNTAGKEQVPQMPMFACGAMTQGQIGLLIQQSLNNIFRKEKIDKSVVTVVTQVEVSSSDPSFQNPAKPVGPFYTEEEALKIGKSTGFVMKEDAGRGWRRVVPSPQPINIVELEAIKDLLEKENVVIASGGGGIPVIMKDDNLQGVDAVIDKDKSAALMGDELNADLLIILTAVEKAALDFGKENQTEIDKMTISEARKYLAEGHFAPGSMKPKVEAIVDFIEKNPDRKALITSANKLPEAMEEKSGTWITG